MLDFTGVKCPVCGAPFRQEDDIVVCPECGAPYHRECYQQVEKCIFEDLHAQGKEWTPPLPKIPEPTAEIKDRECPRCGTLNGRSSRFCTLCGTALPQDAETPSGAAGDVRTPPPHTAPPYRPYAPPFAFDPMGGVSPVERLDTDVTFGEVSKLVKQNTNYYMPVFRYIKQTGRNKFNFSAFLFSGAWLLYRKQYRIGAVVTGLMFTLFLAFQCSLWLVSYPALSAVAQQAGIDLSQAAALTNEQLLSISSLIAQDMSLYFRVILPFVVLLFLLICMIFTGVRGNKLYLNHCIETVRLVRREGTDGDPNMTLDAKGGVNPMASLCVTLCYLVLRTVIPLLL